MLEHLAFKGEWKRIKAYFRKERFDYGGYILHFGSRENRP